MFETRSYPGVNVSVEVLAQIRSKTETIPELGLCSETETKTWDKFLRPDDLNDTNKTTQLS